MSRDLWDEIELDAIDYTAIGIEPFPTEAEPGHQAVSPGRHARSDESEPGDQAGSPGRQDGPVTSWAAVARVVGVSVDTVARARAAAGFAGRPAFADAAEARAWFRGLPRRPSRPVEIPAPRSRSRRTTARADDAPVDWAKIKV